MATATALDAVTAALTGVRTALLADGTLPGLLGDGLKIVTGAPSSYPCPYISVDARANDWSTATEDGQECLIDLNVWTQPPTQTPETGLGRQIMALCRQILHTAALSLPSPFHCVQCRVENQIGPYRDPDGTTLHGVVSLRILVDHT